MPVTSAAADTKMAVRRRRLPAMCSENMEGMIAAAGVGVHLAADL